MIKAIQTRYKGYFFRSRLEARWAVAFDAMGLDWEYEPEGFELPSGKRYLPDFRIRLKPKGRVLWVEIKPNGAGSPEFDEFMQFAGLDVRGTILHEIPDPVAAKAEGILFHYYTNDEPYCWFGGDGNDDGPNGWGDCTYVLTACPTCRAVGFEFDGRSARIGCSCPVEGHPDKGYNSADPIILNAFAAARAARFEHGDREEWST